MENDSINDNISYNKAIEEIESILKEMQNENCDIDRLAENTKRAARLIDFCKKKLTLTEKEIQSILSSFSDSAEE